MLVSYTSQDLRCIDRLCFIFPLNYCWFHVNSSSECNVMTYRSFRENAPGQRPDCQRNVSYAEDYSSVAEAPSSSLPRQHHSATYLPPPWVECRLNFVPATHARWVNVRKNVSISLTMSHAAGSCLCAWAAGDLMAALGGVESQLCSFTRVESIAAVIVKARKLQEEAVVRRMPWQKNGWLRILLVVGCKKLHFRPISDFCYFHLQNALRVVQRTCSGSGRCECDDDGFGRRKFGDDVTGRMYGGRILSRRREDSLSDYDRVHKRYAAAVQTTDLQTRKLSVSTTHYRYRAVVFDVWWKNGVRFAVCEFWVRVNV